VESAEICDCGFNFRSGEKDPSFSKEADYEKLARESGVDSGNVRGVNQEILLRIFFSPTFIMGIPILSAVPHATWTCPVALELLGVILFFNVYSRNKYSLSLGLRIWKYPLIGILAGFITGWVLRIPLTILEMKGAGEIASPTAVMAAHWGLMYVLGLAGLWIGARWVLRETTQYIR
jgi:hypothetical protein